MIGQQNPCIDIERSGQACLPDRVPQSLSSVAVNTGKRCRVLTVKKYVPRATSARRLFGIRYKEK
ncbi:MAG: hypothetical protein ACREX0_20905 [Noviherbaspirillum sp.]